MGVKMETEEIFIKIQKAVRDVPLILIGTGGTIPYGIPGMKELADFLIKELDAKYNTDEEWKIFATRLQAGKDLENALTDLNLSNKIIKDITCATWSLVSKDDLIILNQLIQNHIVLPLGKLFSKLYKATPQCVNIVTTNYDRLIEYSCDQMELPICTLFKGDYIRRHTTNIKVGCSKTVNIMKVHGSLDWFADNNKEVYAIPIQHEIPKGMLPQIIPPGSAKYRRAMQEPFREIIHNADNLMDLAKCYLCIGYGFNDEQIQNNLIKGIRREKPIVVVTKSVSVEARKLVVDNSQNYIIIQEDKTNEDKSEIIIPEGSYIIEGKYWPLDKFLEII